MDLKEKRAKNREKLDSETLTAKEEQAILQQDQIISCTEKAEIEAQIKAAELRKANAEADNAEAQVDKTKAETTTTKVEKYVKIGGLAATFISVGAAVYTAVKLNTQNIKAHHDSELEFTGAERKVEESLFVKSIDTIFNLFKK